MSREHSPKELIIGAALGTLLGGVAALLSAPKSGEAIRSNIRSFYDDISSGRKWKEEEECGTRDILIGTAVGGLIGAVAGLILAPKSGAELRQDLSETYEDLSGRADEFVSDAQKKGKSFIKNARKQSNKWLDLAHSVADNLIEEAGDASEEYLDGAKRHMENAMEWASLGYKVWQGLQKKRR